MTTGNFLVFQEMIILKEQRGRHSNVLNTCTLYPGIGRNYWRALLFSGGGVGGGRMGVKFYLKRTNIQLAQEIQPCTSIFV